MVARIEKFIKYVCFFSSKEDEDASEIKQEAEDANKTANKSSRNSRGKRSNEGKFLKPSDGVKKQPIPKIQFSTPGTELETTIEDSDFELEDDKKLDPDYRNTPIYKSIVSMRRRTTNAHNLMDSDAESDDDFGGKENRFPKLGVKRTSDGGEGCGRKGVFNGLL